MELTTPVVLQLNNFTTNIQLHMKENTFNAYITKEFLFRIKLSALIQPLTNKGQKIE